MDVFIWVLIRLILGLPMSCEANDALLLQDLLAPDPIPRSWLFQWHTNYCYRSYGGNSSVPNRLAGGDLTLFHHGRLRPHTYGTFPGEEDAVILFNEEGHFTPHLYHDDPRYLNEMQRLKDNDDSPIIIDCDKRPVWQVTC